MARILISDPRADLRAMTSRMVERLGHEAIEVSMPAPGPLSHTDLVLVDRADATGRVLCRAAHRVNPGLALVCLGRGAHAAELRELEIEFSAVLPKPFNSSQLADVIDGVLTALRG